MRGKPAPLSFEFLLQVFRSVALAALGYFGRCAGGEDSTATTSALWSHINDVVGLTDDVEVVFDDYDRIAAVYESAQHIHQYADVLEVQARGRLVEDEYGVPCVFLGQFGSQFHALALTAAECCGGLSELDVSESDVLQRLDASQDIGYVLEEVASLVDCHVEHVGNGLALIAHFERLAVVAFAVTLLAGHLNVGQEVHLNGFIAIAATRLATPALDVEREAAGLVAANLGFGQVDEQAADVGEDAGIGSRIRAWRPSDGRLVDVDYLVDMFQTLDAVVRHGSLQGTVEMAGEDRVERIVDERRLAGARDAGDNDEFAQREFNVDVLEVVAAAAMQFK